MANDLKMALVEYANRLTTYAVGAFDADLRAVELAASNKLPRTPENARAVAAGIENMIGAYCGPLAAMNAQCIAEAFWLTDIGKLIAQAQIWAMAERMLTVQDAAALLYSEEIANGMSANAATMRLGRLVEAGKLKRYQDTNEPNPRRAGRIDRLELEALMAGEDKRGPR